MTKIKTTLLVATMALAIAGCAKKRPAVLPPAPVDQNAATDPNAGQTTPTDGAIVLGRRLQAFGDVEHHPFRARSI